MKRRLLFCFLTLSFMVQSSRGFSASINISELADRLDRIEGALTGVQKKLSNNYIGSSKQPSDGGSEDKQDAILMQLQETEQAVRQLTGEVETLRFTQGNLQDSIDRVNADVSIRFKEMEDKLVAIDKRLKIFEDEKLKAENAKQEAEKKKKAAATAAAKAEKERKDKLNATYGKKSPKELYDEAYGAIKKQDYKTAQTLFEAFLELHPKNELAGNAQYWLGESFFARSLFDKAAISFAEGFQNYRDSQKAPDNLFKLGLTMVRLNKKEEACIAFQNFSKEYPKVPEAMKKRLQKELQKLSCQ